MVRALQRLSRWQALRRRWWWTEQRGRSRQWSVDLFIHPEKRRAGSGEAGRSFQARLPPRTKRELYAVRQVDRISVKYVRPNSRLRSRSKASRLVPFRVGISLVVSMLLTAHAVAEKGIAVTSGAPVKFSFGKRARKSSIQIAPNTSYDSARGYGFMQAPTLQQDRDSVCAAARFLFSVSVPEGN